MVTKEPITEFVNAHSNGVLSVNESAFGESRGQALPLQTDPIIVTMEFDVPENRVFPEELELIEQHLGDMLREMLLCDDSKE